MFCHPICFSTQFKEILDGHFIGCWYWSAWSYHCADVSRFQPLIVTSLKTTTVWNVVLWHKFINILQVRIASIIRIDCPDDGGHKRLRNVGKFLPDYAMFHPRLAGIYRSVQCCLVVGISSLVVRYFQSLLSTTELHVSGQPVEVWGGEGKQANNSTYGVFLPLTIFLALTVTWFRFGDILQQVYLQVYRALPPRGPAWTQISGCHGDDYEDDNILGYCTV